MQFRSPCERKSHPSAFNQDKGGPGVEERDGLCGSVDVGWLHLPTPISAGDTVTCPQVTGGTVPVPSHGM